MIDSPPSYDTIINYPSLSQLNSTQQIQQTQQNYTKLNPISSSSSTLNSSSSLRYYNHLSNSVTRPKMNEIKLFQDSNERRRNEELGDLYSIIKTTESLEAAFSRDAITSSEYSEACTRLISQFKSTESALITGGMISSAELFMKEYEIDCPRAYDRLIKSGVPATVLHVSHDDRADSVIVAETVQVIFIIIIINLNIIKFFFIEFYYFNGCSQIRSKSC